MTQRIYIDTEFVNTAEGVRFISAAFLTDRDDELYAELPLSEAEALLSQYPNEFVSQHVLPQLGRYPRVLWAELPARFSEWLADLGTKVVEVIYDYSSDYLLVEELQGQMSTPLPVLLVPSHVGYLLGDEEGERAAVATWHLVEDALGLSRHHAFADVAALRSRFETVHRPELEVEDGTVEMLATVTAVLPEFEFAKADTDDGKFSLTIGNCTRGVSWKTLVAGQRLRCIVQRRRLTSVLHAVLLRDAD